MTIVGGNGSRFAGRPGGALTLIGRVLSALLATCVASGCSPTEGSDTPSSAGMASLGAGTAGDSSGVKGAFRDSAIAVCVLLLTELGAAASRVDWKSQPAIAIAAIPQAEPINTSWLQPGGGMTGYAPPWGDAGLVDMGGSASSGNGWLLALLAVGGLVMIGGAAAGSRARRKKARR